MNRLLIGLAAASVAFAPAAFADPGNGHGNGKAKGHDKAFVGGPPGFDHATPPGLAKKPYGMPPGQAKKAWRKGQYLPRSYYIETRYVVVEPLRYHLSAPPPGYRWVRVDGDAYLVRTSNGLVADVVANALIALLR